MSLIKCKECGKEISDTATCCVHCGCPIIKETICPECKKTIPNQETVCPNCGFQLEGKSEVQPKNKTFNKRTLIPILLVAVIILIIVLVIVFTNGDKLVCNYENSSSVGTLKYEVTYNFKNNDIKSINGYQYAKANDDRITSSLWSSTNNPTLQNNNLEGVTYKATLSEAGEIKINYSLDVEKAPSLFNSVVGLAGVSGVTISMNKNAIKEIYENNNFICK